MSPWTKEQRAIAAAHLCDLAAESLRADHGGVGLLLRAAESVVLGGASEVDYREALRDHGASLDDIDAAVAAIARGEHPPDSLPGQVAAYRGRVVREAARILGSYREHHCEGEVKALGHVLTLLGCEVPK